MAPETKVLIYLPRVKHRLAVSEDSVKKHKSLLPHPRVVSNIMDSV